MSTLSLFRQSRRLRASAIGIFFLGAVAASLAPYQGLIAIRLFGFSDAAFAAIFTTGSAISAVLAVAVGIWTDQHGHRKTVALASSAIGVAGFAAVYFTGAAWAYLLSALVTNPIGFTIMGQLFAIARLAAEDHSVARRDGAMAVVRAGFALPFIVILPLWSIAFQNDTGLVLIYAATMCAGLMMFLTVLLLLPKDGTEGKAETGSGLSWAAALGELAHPRVSFRVALLAAIVAANAIYMSTMGLVFESLRDDGVARTAQFAALVAGAEIPFMLLIPVLSARLSKTTILATAAAIYAAFLLLFPILAAGPYVWALVLLAGSGAAVLLTVPIAYFQDLLSARPGTSSSLQAVQMVASQVIAGGLFWVGTSVGGYGLVMGLGALVSVAAAVLLWTADRTRPA